VRVCVCVCVCKRVCVYMIINMCLHDHQHVFT